MVVLFPPFALSLMDSFVRVLSIFRESDVGYEPKIKGPDAGVVEDMRWFDLRL